jgi:hypothetical protein
MDPSDFKIKACDDNMSLPRHILLYKKSLHDMPEDKNLTKTDQKGG